MEVREYVALVPLDMFYYPQLRIKNYLLNNLMGREYGDSLLYCPTLKLQCIDMLSKGVTIYSGTKEETQYIFLLKIENS